MTETPDSRTPRAAIVTGATSGIGEATARALYAEGYAVLLTGRSRKTGEALAANLGSRARFFAADLTETDAAQLVVEAALAFAGRLDVLVNNAGIDYTGDLLTTPLDDVRAVFETNTFGTISMLQAAGRAMKGRGGGSIINITSRLASSESRPCPFTRRPRARFWLSRSLQPWNWPHTTSGSTPSRRG